MSTPEFKSASESPDSLHHNSEHLTAHGICAEFASFFTGSAVVTDRARAAAMFEQVERVVRSNADDSDNLTNALCTCFLENIAQTEVGRAVAPLMGPTSRRFFDEWDAGT